MTIRRVGARWSLPAGGGPSSCGESWRSPSASSPSSLLASGSRCSSASSPPGRSSTAPPTWCRAPSRGRDRSWWLRSWRGSSASSPASIALLFPVLAAEVARAHHRRLGDRHRRLRDRRAIRLREQITGELWLGLAGLASILFGVVLFLFPGVGALSLVWLIGGFAIAFGAFGRARLAAAAINELARPTRPHDYSR